MEKKPEPTQQSPDEPVYSHSDDNPSHSSDDHSESDASSVSNHSSDHPTPIQDKQLPPPLSPKSVEKESNQSLEKEKSTDEQPVNTLKSKRTKKEQNERFIIAGVEQLIQKIKAAIQADIDSIAKNQSGSLISFTKAVPSAGN